MESQLTESEERSLQQMARGLMIREAAAERGIAKSTIKSQLEHARWKLRARNTTHAVCLALGRGLIADVGDAEIYPDYREASETEETATRRAFGLLS